MYKVKLTPYRPGLAKIMHRQTRNDSVVIKELALQ